MLITNIILFISIVNFILTLFVFLNAKELKQHISFLIFSFVTTIWLFDNFLFRIYPHTVFGPLAYGLGILVATFAVVWLYNLVEEKIPLFIFYFVIPFSILVFFISSFTNYVVLSFGKLEPLGYTTEKGVLFVEYALYLGLLIVICLYKLAKKSIQERDILKKKQILSIFIGSLIFGLLAYITDFLMPIFFNIFEFSSLVNIAYFFLFIFIIYSILRHGLFGIKLIITQFLVVILLSLLLLNFLLSNSLNEYIWSGTLLLISTFLSYLIMKSVFTEIKLNKKLLEETQKTLKLEQSTRKEFIEKSGKIIRTMENIVSIQNKGAKNRRVKN